MWMNVLETLTCAISMPLATILKGVTPALATEGTQEMGYFAQVSVSIFQSEHIAILPGMYYSCTTLGQKWVKFVCFLCFTVSFQKFSLRMALEATSEHSLRAYPVV